MEEKEILKVSVGVSHETCYMCLGNCRAGSSKTCTLLCARECSVLLADRLLFVEVPNLT